MTSETPTRPEHRGHGEGLNMFIGRVSGCPACEASAAAERAEVCERSIDAFLYGSHEDDTIIDGSGRGGDVPNRPTPPPALFDLLDVVADNTTIVDGLSHDQAIRALREIRDARDAVGDFVPAAAGGAVAVPEDPSPKVGDRVRYENGSLGTVEKVEPRPATVTVRWDSSGTEGYIDSTWLTVLAAPSGVSETCEECHGERVVGDMDDEGRPVSKVCPSCRDEAS